jgi:uncharacterized protein
MPVSLSSPGVYIQEIPSGVHTITGVATSITAFVGRAWKGPLDEPTRISSYAEYERTFGGLWAASMMSYAVQQFFLNGGSTAIIVRVATRVPADAPTAASINLTGGMVLEAASPGSWGMNLLVTAEDKTHTDDKTDSKRFNLIIKDNNDPATPFLDSGKRGGSGATETFRNVSVDPNSPRYVKTILEQQSSLVRHRSGTTAPTANNKGATAGTGTDGVSTTLAKLAVATAEVEGVDADNTGIYALRKTDLFNLLCIPPLTLSDNSTSVPTTEKEVQPSTWAKAASFCRERRAFLLVDAPLTWNTVASADPDFFTISGTFRQYAAVYFPQLLIPDPLQENNLSDFAPCGTIAGVMARTDAQRGVWKAPAGIDAGLSNVAGLALAHAPVKLTDDNGGVLNQLGINCIRTFPVIGTVVWGARTLDGADRLASEWKYVPVRRTALYIEESLYRGTQWVVFEPNDEPLWAQIRLNVGAFMHTLFTQGAFQGITPKEAYFVKCDKETTTQADINLGVVNIVVGFAPLKPAEFVVISLQQMAGQIQT